MLGSKCGLKIHVRNLGYILPLQIGGPKPSFFRRLRNLTAILTAYIFGAKHDADNRQVRWQLQGVSYIVHKPLQIGPAFLHTLRKFCFLLHCRLCRRWSANVTELNWIENSPTSTEPNPIPFQFMDLPKLCTYLRGFHIGFVLLELEHLDLLHTNSSIHQDLLNE